MRPIKWMAAGLCLTISAFSAVAQEASCEALDSLISQASAQCSDAEVGVLCVAAGQASVDDETLQAGDGWDTADLFSLRSLPIEEADTISLATLRLRAGLDEGQSVQLVLYGDAQLDAVIDEAAEALMVLSAINAAGYDINLRSGPATSFAEAGALADGAEVLVDGQSADGQWLRVETDEGSAWVAARLLAVDGDIASLAVLSDAPAYDEAFQNGLLFTAVQGSELCGQPTNGLLVRNDQDGEARLALNGVALVFGRGAFVAQATLSEGLLISVIEGTLSASANGTEVSLSARESLNVALDDVLLASGAPTEAEWPAERLASAPLGLLGLSLPTESQASAPAALPVNQSTAPTRQEGSFVPAQTTIFQADSGPDVLSGTCNTPPIAACSHPAAIIPNPDGSVSWRGQEPTSYPMTPTGLNTFIYRGRNFVGNANLTLELTLTSADSWQMTMTTVYDNDPLCNHTYYYNAVRR